MKPLLHWLTSPEWTQLVTALLHSLWQGALLAGLLALLMRRLTQPRFRYYAALSALAILVLASPITWAVLNTPPAPAPNPSTPVISESFFPSPAHPPSSLADADKVVVIGTRTTPAPAPIHWTAWLALVWMLGAGLMLLRAGLKVAGAEKLRRSCRPLTDETMTLLVVEACRAINLARKIRVAVTDQLTSPAVVGVLVPTLILPLSLFTTLTPEQIRFILLHELAHIRRGDYFANLFQLLAEALLFFNPAVWWLSHLIRREREACCDALAIKLSGAPADYAKTLVRVAENILPPAPTTALAFGEPDREPSSLADRVQRLLVPGYRPSLRLTWRAMLASLCVGGTLLFLSAVGTRNTVGAILSPEKPSLESQQPSQSRLSTTASTSDGAFPSDASNTNLLRTNLLLKANPYAGRVLKPKSPETSRTPVTEDNANDPLEVQIFQIPREAMVMFSGIRSTNAPHAKTESSTHDSTHPETELDIARALESFLYLCDFYPANYRGDSLLYDAQAGALRVRATRRDLDQMELVIRVLNLNPPPVPAAETTGSGSWPFDYNSRIMSITNGGRTNFLGQELTADHIQFDRATGDVVARGNARFVTTNGTYSGSKLRINRASNLVSGTDYKLTISKPTISSIAHPSLALRRELALSPPSAFELDRWAVGSDDPFNSQWFFYRAAAGQRITNTTEQFIQRTFEIDLAKFFKAVQASAGLAATPTLTNIGPYVRPYFAQAGIHLTPEQGKSFYLNTRGVLAVRATKEELDQVETLLRPMPGIPVFSRTYPINPVAIAQIAASLPPELGAMVATNPAAGFRKLIESFDATDPRPKGVHYLPDRGELIARATEADHNQFSILLQERPKPSPTLATREYKLPVELVQERILSNAYPLQVIQKDGVLQAHDANRMELAHQTMRKWFADAGVELDPRQGKSIYYNDRAGILWARATPEELDSLETTIRELMWQPPQVNLKIRWVETSDPQEVMRLNTNFPNIFFGDGRNIKNLSGTLTRTQANHFSND